jgi:hypothetical protein
MPFDHATTPGPRPCIGRFVGSTLQPITVQTDTCKHASEPVGPGYVDMLPVRIRSPMAAPSPVPPVDLSAGNKCRISPAL